MDIAGGIVGCLLTVILIIVIGPMIYIKSPGPIFFSQVRIGKNGKKFKIYKFRSMYMDAEERKAELMSQNKMEGLMFKMDYDPRIIGSEKKDKTVIQKESETLSVRHPWMSSTVLERPERRYEPGGNKTTDS